MSLLDVTDLSVAYGDLFAVREVSFAVDVGAVFVLLGANGAGKTSILRSISGLAPARSGRILAEGRDLRGLAPNQVARSGISHVPEGRQIFPNLSVDENLAVSYLKERTKDTMAKALASVYELFPRLAERRKQLGGTLSGGEQQMLAIGRALMARPQLLMLDEPSMGIAPILVQRIYETIGEINRSGVAILLVEQNANYALDVARRGYVLETGRVALENDSAALRDDPEVQRAYLGT